MKIVGSLNLIPPWIGMMLASTRLLSLYLKTIDINLKKQTNKKKKKTTETQRHCRSLAIYCIVTMGMIYRKNKTIITLNTYYTARFLLFCILL